MDKMRADPARPLVRQHQRFAFDARQAANARSDRTPRAQPFFLAHVEQAGIPQRLAGRRDAEHDEQVDLALDLVVHVQIGVEAIFMVLGLHFARDAALIIGRVEPGYRRRAGFGRDDVLPGGFDISAKRSHHAKTGYDDTTHMLAPKFLVGA